MRSGALQRMAFHIKCIAVTQILQEYPPDFQDLSCLTYQIFGWENPIRKYCSLALRHKHEEAFSSSHVLEKSGGPGNALTRESWWAERRSLPATCSGL